MLNVCYYRSLGISLLEYIVKNYHSTLSLFNKNMLLLRNTLRWCIANLRDTKALLEKSTKIIIILTCWSASLFIYFLLLCKLVAKRKI